jgi:hypothetical protein
MTLYLVFLRAVSSAQVRRSGYELFRPFPNGFKKHSDILVYAVAA